MDTTEVIQANVSTSLESQNNANDVKLDQKLQEPPNPAPVPVQEQLSQTTQQQQQQQQPVRTRPTREEKLRKKDDKSVDHVLKALNSLNTTEEKLAAMCKKYADILEENRKVQQALKQAEKRCSTLQREKEQLQTEHSKAILTRSRLENLCRELQRQSKAIKDESLLKIREEEEKRKEVSAKFQATLNEITTLMQQNNDKNMKLRDDNIDMNAKLKNVCEQYELREQQVEKISKQMQLEAQLADAKLAKAKMEIAAEREIMLREKQQILMELSQYQARCQEYQATEINLRGQISLYDNKYDEFQKALARSNEVFGGFKGEMEKMSKKMCKLEKEVSTWKGRWEGSHRALLEMAEEKQKSDQELNQTKRQLLTLQRLCRTLQGERSSLLAKLKESPSGDDKVDDDVSKIDDASNMDTELIGQPLLNGDKEPVSNEISSTVSDKNKVESLPVSLPPKENETNKINGEISVENNLPTISPLTPSINNSSSYTLIKQNVGDDKSNSPIVAVNDSTCDENVAGDKQTVSPIESPEKITVSLVNEPSGDSPDSINTTASSTSPPKSNVTDSPTNTEKPTLVNESIVNNNNSTLKESSNDDSSPTIVDNKSATTDNSPVAVVQSSPPTSQDNSNKQPNGIVLNDKNYEVKLLDNNSTESKQKTNVENTSERPVKKQNNEMKKGKESKKKKKNT